MNLKTIGIVLIFNIYSSLAFSQDWNRYWCFGDSAAIDFSDPANPLVQYSEMDCAFSSASIGDSSNGLLMYAHNLYWPIHLQGQSKSTVVHNRYHSLMQNGDYLIGSFHNEMVFLQQPGSDSVFYLFHCGFTSDSGFYYSIVEPYYNNDSGRVVVKNVPLTLNSHKLLTSVITARHANGRDWWLIVRNWDQSNKFNSYLFTPTSILGPIEQSIGTISQMDVGSMAFSKQGNKIALVNTNGLIEVYAFDRCSGIISNPETINYITGNSFFGCEFSPSGNLLYVSNTNNAIINDSLRIFQYDLTAANISLSLKRIYSELVPTNGGLLKRGPDNKIYFTCLHNTGWPYPDTCRNLYNENLSVINDPDSMGMACNFSPFSFYLGGKRAYWNLPNNADYTLKNMANSVCDTLITGTHEINTEKIFLLYPNPASSQVQIYSPFYMGPIKIYDMLGSLVFEAKKEDHLISIDVTKFKAGLYFLVAANKITRKLEVIR